MDARRSGRTWSSSPRQGSAASTPTPAARPTSSTTISRSQTNVIHTPPRSACASCCSSARPASIRGSRRSRSPKSALLTGPLEPTNQWYAIAKIAGLMLCQAYREQYGCDFISAMPTNLYGPGDNFDLEGAHVLPALLRRFREAALRRRPQGRRSGAPARRGANSCTSTICADALVFLLRHYSRGRHDQCRRRQGRDHRRARRASSPR